MAITFTRRTAIAQMTSGFALAACTTSKAPTPEASGLLDTKKMTKVEGVFDLYTSNSRPLVMLTSGESLPVPVLFDTGTSGNMIDKSVFQQFGLKKKPDHKSFITDASGTTIETFATTIPQAQLGSVSIANATMDVADYRVDDEVGILGPELFNGSSVYLNMPKRSVYVRNAPATPLNIPDAEDYVLNNASGLPMMRFTIDGFPESLLGVIDTGKNGALSFPESMIDQLPLVAPPSQVGTATTVFKTVPVYGAQLAVKVHLGGVILDKPEVIFHGNSPKIGMPVLQKLRIWLEPHNQRSWLATARSLGDTETEAYTGRFGIRKINRGSSGLIYQRDLSPERRLIYLGADHFLFEHDDTDLIFRRNDAGDIVGYTLLNEVGRPFEVSRS